MCMLSVFSKLMLIKTIMRPRMYLSIKFPLSIINCTIYLESAVSKVCLSFQNSIGLIP